MPKKVNTKDVTEVKSEKVESVKDVTDTKDTQKGGKKDAKKDVKKDDKKDAKKDKVDKENTKEDAKKDAKKEVKKDGKKDTKPKKVVKKPKKQDGGDEEEKNGKRYFKCVYDGNTQGRYSGDKPKQAANKAFTNIVRNYDGDCIGLPITFEMVECTRGSPRKCSKYLGKRTKLDKPLEIKITKNTDKPKIITYRFYNKISKVKDQVDPQAGGKKVVKKKGAKTSKTTTSKKVSKK